MYLKIAKVILFVALAFSLVVSLDAFRVFSNRLFQREKVVASDYVSFLTGAYIVGEGRGKSLYDINYQLRKQKDITEGKRDKLLPFMSIPAVAVLYLPFSQTSLYSGYFVTFFLCLSLAVIYIYVCSKAVDGRLMKWIVVLTGLSFLPIYYVIANRQISILIALLIVGIYYSLNKKNDFVAGVFAGMISLKPQFLVLLIPFCFLSTNKKNYVKGVVFVLVFFVVTSFILGGLNFISDYLGLVKAVESADYGNAPQKFYTLNSLLLIWMGDRSQTSFWMYLIELILALGLFIVLGRMYKFSGKINRDLFFSSSVILTIPLAIHCMTHDLSILLFPVALLFDLSRRIKSDTKKILVLFVLLLIIVIPPAAVTTSFENHVFSVLFLLLGLALYRMGKEGGSKTDTAFF